jgi:hypothetical protein
LVQDISGYNLLQGVARTSLGWTYGKLNLRVGYEYNAQTTSSDRWTDEREKHRFYTYLRRTF